MSKGQPMRIITERDTVGEQLAGILNYHFLPELGSAHKVDVSAYPTITITPAVGASAPAVAGYLFKNTLEPAVSDGGITLQATHETQMNILRMHNAIAAQLRETIPGEAIAEDDMGRGGKTHPRVNPTGRDASWGRNTAN